MYRRHPMATMTMMPATLAGKTPDRLYKFQFTNLNNNNNKWYTYEVYQLPGNDIHIIGKYGRVGDESKYQIKDWGVHYGDGFLDRLLQEREYRKGYKPIQLHAVPAPGQ